MNKNIYVTFSGSAYDSTTKLIVEDGPKFGATEVRVYDDRWLMTQPFYARNKWLWETETKFGFGWCSWKSFVIQHALANADPGDVVLYTDADTFPIADLTPIFDYTREHSVMLFEEQGCINKVWTKRDCFRKMGVDDEFCHARIMACGRFQAFTRYERLHWTDHFLRMWEDYSTLRDCQLWDRSVNCEDYPEFRRHSCEQSVLSNLAYRYNVPCHRTPDQNGSIDKDWDLYPQVFVQQYCTGDRGNLSGSKYFNVGSR